MFVCGINKAGGGRSRTRDAKDVRMFPKPQKPIRDREYLNWLKVTNRCLRCGSPATDAHHVRWAGDCGMGTRPGDYYTIPLCRACHDLAHNDPVKFGQIIGREEALEFMMNSVIEWMEIKNYTENNL